MRIFALCLVSALILAGCAATGTAPESPQANSPQSEPATTETLTTGPSLTGPATEPTTPAPEPVEEVVDDPPATLYARLSNTPLMAGPDVRSVQLDILDASARLVRFGVRGQWARVLDAASGHTGWIENRLLTPKPPARHEAPGDGIISETF